jgi:hypothetical protein
VPPFVATAVKVTEVPEQIAPVGLAVMLTDGETPGLMITDVVPAKLVQPPTVSVTEYVPAIADDALVSAGFCKADENAFGPVQL